MKRTIQIHTTAGAMEIEAFVHKHLAVHEVRGASDLWTISHLPTGCSFAQCGVFKSEEHARAALDAMYGEWPRWDVTFTAIKRRGQRIKRLFWENRAVELADHGPRVNPRGLPRLNATVEA